jgi:outer membrane lipoprotein LolB
VTLQTSDGKSFHAASAEQLLTKNWGFNLPVSNMRYWIRSLPVPDMAANTQYDSKGRLATLVQQGWRIDYLNYSNVGGVDLPERLSITSPALRVKIVVYQWRLS